MWSGECGVCVECKVRSVKCGGEECKVQSVKCKVWSVKC